MRSACAEALRHIYIYTHRESLVRNHEPCAKALGNYYPAHAQRMRRSVTDIYIYIYIYIYTHRESLVRNHEPCAKALGNYYYPAHAQKRDRHIYIPIARAYCAIMSLALRRFFFFFFFFLKYL